MILSLALSALLQSPGPADEARYYAVDYLTPPEGAVLEVGGMDFLSDGRLVVSTRRGQVWFVENPLDDDPNEARFTLFAEGLWEGLGLNVINDQIFIVQRGELSRLVDEDDDGVCDRIDTITDDWGLSGNYHEFAYGLPDDPLGNLYVTLNVAFFSPKWWHGKSPEPWRGWILRINPDGGVIPVASGLRSPCGLGIDAAGRLLVTDNQGDWMPASPIFHIEEGGFYGHPASLDWTDAYRSTQTLASDTIPPARAATDRKPAAVWLPYKWSRSPGNLVFDPSEGAFGPFAEQLFLAELTNGMVLRVLLEEVQGVVQGAVLPFRQKVGSACRVAFAPDGTLFTGFTNRGWGGLPPSHGLGRIRPTGETPFEIHGVHLVQDGFELTFTKALAADSTLGPASVRLIDYDYDYWWEYGSPERDTRELAVERIELASDRRSLTVHAAGLEAGRVARMNLFGLVAEDGTPLLHEEFAYTINQLPEGPLATAHVAKIVPPPPMRQSGEEGWLRLTYGDATDAWQFEGWELCDTELDPSDNTRLRSAPGVSALTNTAAAEPTDYVSKAVFGDVSLHFEVFLPEGGATGVRLMDRYLLRIVDREAGHELTNADCGTIAGPAADRSADVAPTLAAWSGPGQWHDIDVVFRAPRFDASGAKSADARFETVSFNDVVIHDNIELAGPSSETHDDEVALAPLAFVGTRGPVAIGNVRVKPLRDDENQESTADWVSLLPTDEDELATWKRSDEALWTFDGDVLVGEGPRGHLFSPRDDYANFELRARLKINEGGNSGLYFRTQYGEGWPAGYEAQINSSFADPQKTGSLYTLAPRTTHLIPPDTWFDLRVSCRDEDEGTRIGIWVNGIQTVDHLDRERLHGPGHIALQQHHDGSVLEVESLLIREWVE